jgi:ABC-type Zn uptake system ZnuABC Zn-binding protein ZnuA
MDIADSIESLDVVTVDESIVLREFSDSHDDEHEDDGHDHTGIDPHYWLDFNNAQVIAQTIYTKLSEKYPNKESIFKENYDAYMVELDDARIRSQKKLGELTNRNIITFHDAWRYFAEEMGLVIVGSFEPEAGKQPGPQFITTLMDSINEHDVKALFSEPQLSDDVVRVLSDDMDLPVYILDPLGGTVDKESYIEMMEYNVNVIYNALQ